MDEMKFTQLMEVLGRWKAEIVETFLQSEGIEVVLEEGIITKEHTAGLELNFGNGAAALELLHQMARGEGFGVIVGQGVRYMKEYFARDHRS